MPIAENEFEAFGPVSDMELGAGFDGEPFSLEGFHHSHLREELAIIGQERFTDMKARETLLFQNENALSGARQKGGGAAATGPAANHQRIVNHVCHGRMKRQNRFANKHEVSSSKPKAQSSKPKAQSSKPKAQDKDQVASQRKFQP